MVKKGAAMYVSFNPNVNFKQQAPQMPKDNVQQNSKQTAVMQQQKKPSGFREDISKKAKLFTSLNEMTKASFKAAGYGALTSAVSLAGFWAFGAVPRGFKKGNKILDAFKHPIKNISTKGKVITAVLGLGVAAYHIIKGLLITNQRTANVDHQLKTGHRPA